MYIGSLISFCFNFFLPTLTINSLRMPCLVLFGKETFSDELWRRLPSHSFQGRVTSDRDGTFFHVSPRTQNQSLESGIRFRRLYGSRIKTWDIWTRDWFVGQTLPIKRRHYLLKLRTIILCTTSTFFCTLFTNHIMKTYFRFTLLLNIEKTIKIEHDRRKISLRKFP